MKSKSFRILNTRNLVNCSLGLETVQDQAKVMHACAETGPNSCARDCAFVVLVPDLSLHDPAAIAVDAHSTFIPTSSPIGIRSMKVRVYRVHWLPRRLCGRLAESMVSIGTWSMFPACMAPDIWPGDPHILGFASLQEDHGNRNPLSLTARIELSVM